MPGMSGGSSGNGVEVVMTHPVDVDRAAAIGGEDETKTTV